MEEIKEETYLGSSNINKSIMKVNPYKIKKFKTQKITEDEKRDKSIITKTKAVRKSLSLNLIVTKEDVYRFLMKNPNSRTNQEINIYARYLSQHFQYFTKLKNEDSQLKVEKLAKVCKLEKAMKGESIINFGEIGDKFYIVLEGVVEIYKPIYVEISATPNDFINALNKMKMLDGNELRYNRLKEKNKTFFDSLVEKDKRSEILEINYMKYKQVFIMEEYEKLAEFGDGFSFGDIALIKKSPRNATIKAKENCILLTIEKGDYNKALLEFQKKKLSKEIDIFLKTYSFFKYFNHDKVINIFNCFNRKELFKGEYLYKQNIQDDNIYFLNYGIFSIDCKISFSWISDFFNYINYSGKNILQYILRSKKRKIGELLKLIKQCKSKIINDNYVNEDNFKLWDKINEKEMKDNLYKLKKDEEKLNDPEYIFDINLKKVNYNEIFGLEEIFEFKKRFCSCRCISEKAEVNSIRLTDFLKLIINFGEEELNYFINIIDERKKVLKNQIINGIKNIEKKLIFSFDTRYEKIIKALNLDKSQNDEEKANMIFSTLKIKGYNESITDIIDNDTSLLKKEENKVISKKKIKKLKKNQSMETVYNSYGIKLKTKNQFNFSKTKNLFEKKSNKENIEKDENSKIKKIYDLIEKSQNKKKNIISNFPNNRYLNNNENSNYSNNKSLNNTDNSQSTEIKIRKHLSQNLVTKFKIINNLDSKISNEKTNVSNEKSKLISDMPFRKIIKFKKKGKNKIGRNKSMTDIRIKNQEKSISKSVNIYEGLNLPKIKNKYFLNKTNLNEYRKSDKIVFRGNQDYNNFYNIYNEDKNFFLGIEFEKKLKKKFLPNQIPKKEDKILKI